MGTHRGHIFDTTVFLGDPRSNRWPIKRARFQGSKNQAEYQERTVDGRFSLPSCAPIIPDVAQNEAISRPRAIARFWLNCSTRKKTREEGGKVVACSMESGETLGSRSETGMGRGKGRGTWSVYDQFHGKTVIDRFLDFQTDQQTTLVSILLSCFPPLSFIRAMRSTMGQVVRTMIASQLSNLPPLATLSPRNSPSTIFPSLSSSFLLSLLRQIRPKSKKTATTAHT